MDHVHVHLHLTLVLAGVLILAGCGNDTVVAPELEPGEPACSFPLSVGHWDDGSMRHIGAARMVCVCMTQTEFESKSRFDELNEELLADCNREAAKYQFDWTECEADYESKVWLDGPEGPEGGAVWWPTEEVIHPPGNALVCSGES